MHRIDSATKETDKFGAGKHGHTGGDPGSGIPPTRMTAEWHDEVQEEIANAIEQSGIALVKGQTMQLLSAIQHLRCLTLWGSIGAPLGVETIPVVTPGSLAFLNNRFIYGGSAGNVAVSADGGDSWTTSLAFSGGDAVWKFAYGAGVFVAVGANGQVATSADNGASWTLRTSNFGTSGIRDIFFDGTHFVIVGNGGKLTRSTDGITWEAVQTVGSGNFTRIVKANGLWVVVSESGELYTSTTAASGSWTSRTSGFGASQIYGLAYGGGKWVTSGFGGKIATSTDGLSWTLNASHPLIGNIVTSAVYSASQGLWCAGDLDGRVAWATDPAGTWTETFRNNGQGISDVNRIIACPGGFVVGADADRYGYSFTGKAWNKGTLHSSGSATITGLAYGAGVVMAVFTDGAVYRTLQAA